MNYVDGFVVPVPKKNLAAYRRLSLKAGKVWREYGAIDYKEWRLADMMDPKSLPFDAKRMFFGGFKIFVEA